MYGCGIALVTASARWYSSFSFLLFFCSVNIWISMAYTSSSCVPRAWFALPSSLRQNAYSSRRIFETRGNSFSEKNILHNFRLVLNHSRSFRASASASRVVW